MPTPKAFSWSFHNLKDLLAKAYADWSADEAPRMGAALAYYSVLSLAPLLVIATAVAGFVLGRQAAHGELVGRLQGTVSPQAASAIQGLLTSTKWETSSGVIASAIGGIALLFAASTLVAELRSDLDRIWNVPQASGEGLEATIKERINAFLIVLCTGLLLLALMIASATLNAAGEQLRSIIPLPGFVMHIVNAAVTLAIVTALFTIIFKMLPRCAPAWSHVWLGALFTAILFLIGNYLIGLYLGRAGFASAYGAAGSVVVMLVWIYYSAQIVFFGAEVTQAYARAIGAVASRESGTVQEQPTPSSQHPRNHRPERENAMDSYGASAVSGNVGLPPIYRRTTRVDQHPTFAGNLGAILGLAVNTGKRIIRVIKS